MNGTAAPSMVTSNTTVPQCSIHLNVTSVLYSVMMSLMLLLSLCGNVLVIVSIAMSNVLKKRVSSLFITSLACSDLYFAVSLIPIKMSSFLHNSQFCHTLPTCYWYMMSDSLSNVASIINLLAIAVDRYIAIKTPYLYAKKVNKRRAFIVIVVIWLFALFCSVIGIFKWDNNNNNTFGIFIGRMCANDNRYYYLMLFFAIYISTLLSISCIYATILHIALSHIKQIDKTNVSLQQQNRENNFFISSQQSCNGKGKSVNRRTREMKTTKSLAIVYGTFVICWLPSFLIIMITTFNENAFRNLHRSHPKVFMFVFYAFIEVLPSLSTVVNPFIYSFSNRQFRLAFKNVFFKLVGKHMKMGNEFQSFSDVDNGSSRFTRISIVQRITPTIFRRFQKSKTLEEINGSERILTRTRLETL